MFLPQNWARWPRGPLEECKNSPKMSPHRTKTRHHSEEDSPSILITTSREPTSRIRALSNDLSWTLPNSRRLSRGKSGLNEVASTAIRQGCSRVIMLERWKTGTCKVLFYSITAHGLELLPPVLYIKSFAADHELKRRHSRIPIARSIRLLGRDESARKFAMFLSRFLRLELMASHNVQDESGPTLTVSGNERGEVEVYVGTNSVQEGLPLLCVERIVWDSAGA